MATRAVAVDRKRGRRERVIQWTGLAVGDDGVWIEAAGWCIAWFIVSGTFGTATMNIEYDMSDDGSSTNILLSTTAASRQQQTHDNFLAGRIRPRITSGDGTTALAITVVLKAI